MNLQDYIRKIGPAEFAAKVGVSEAAARAWKYGHRVPSASFARRIVEHTPVTYEGIYAKSAQTASESPTDA